MCKDIKQFRKRLLHLLKDKAFKRGRFILSSGKVGSYYIDARSITLSAEGAYLVAYLILDLIKNEKIDAVGGPTFGADPIVGAVAVLSYTLKKPLKTFIIRKEAKAHGTKRQVEGPPLKRGSRVILVDDVVTTGKSFLESIKILRQKGLQVKKAIALVDRQEGAKEILAKEACPLISLFTIADFNP